MGTNKVLIFPSLLMAIKVNGLLYINFKESLLSHKNRFEVRTMKCQDWTGLPLTDPQIEKRSLIGP